MRRYGIQYVEDCESHGMPATQIEFKAKDDAHARRKFKGRAKTIAAAHEEDDSPELVGPIRLFRLNRRGEGVKIAEFLPAAGFVRAADIG